MHKRTSKTILGILAVSITMLAIGRTGPAALAKSHQQPLNIFSKEDPKTPGVPKFKGRPEQPSSGSMSMMNTDGEMPRREIIQAIPSLRDDQRKIINKYFDQTQKSVGPIDDQIRAAEAKLKELKAAKAAALAPSSPGTGPPEWHITSASPASFNPGSVSSSLRSWSAASLTSPEAGCQLNTRKTVKGASAKTPAPSNFWAGPRWTEIGANNQPTPHALLAQPPQDLLLNALIARSSAPKASGASNSGTKLYAKFSSDALPILATALNPVSTSPTESPLSESELTAQIDAAKQSKKDKARTLADQIAVLLTPDQLSDMDGMRHGTLIIVPPPAPPADQPALTARNDKGKN